MQWNFGENSAIRKNTSIRDIVDGTVYKRYKESGGFLTKEDNLTSLFDTDGIPLYKSSKVNAWSVFLAILGTFCSPSRRYLHTTWRQYNTRLTSFGQR